MLRSLCRQENSRTARAARQGVQNPRCRRSLMQLEGLRKGKRFVIILSFPWFTQKINGPLDHRNAIYYLLARKAPLVPCHFSRDTILSWIYIYIYPIDRSTLSKRTERRTILRGFFMKLDTSTFVRINRATHRLIFFVNLPRHCITVKLLFLRYSQFWQSVEQEFSKQLNKKYRNLTNDQINRIF